MLPIQYLFAFPMETKSYLSYRHFRIPEVFKDPGILKVLGLGLGQGYLAFEIYIGCQI